MKFFNCIVTVAVAFVLVGSEAHVAGAQQYSASGTWVVGKRSGTWQADLDRDTNVLRGQIRLGGGLVQSAEVAGTIRGDKVEFGVVSNQQEIASFDGVLSLAQLSGEVTMSGVTGKWSGSWQAVPHTEAPITSSRPGTLEAPFDKPSAEIPSTGDPCDVLAQGAIGGLTASAEMALTQRCMRSASSAEASTLSTATCSPGPPESNPPALPPDQITGALVNVTSRQYEVWPNITQSEPSAMVSLITAAKQTVVYNDTQADPSLLTAVGFGRRDVATGNWTQNLNQFWINGSSTLRIRGDPSGAPDKAGNAQLSLLANDDGFRWVLGMASSTDFGITYSQPQRVIGPIKVNNLDAILDKQWLAIDWTANTGKSNTQYLCWTRVFSNTSSIWFARRPPNAPEFEQPIRVSSVRSLADRVHGCQVAVAPDSSVYVVWWDEVDQGGVKTSGILGARSADGVGFGATFNASGTFTKPEDADATADCSVQRYADGNPALKGHIRVQPFPSLAINRQNGAVYLAYTRRREGGGAGGESEISFVRSTDQGAHWSTPLVVNDSPTGDKFMPAIAHSPKAGAIRVIWYDRRNDPLNVSVDLYEGNSTDGGATFLPNTRVTAGLFGVPNIYGSQQSNFDCRSEPCYMGDYIALTNLDQAPTGAGAFLHSWGDNSLKIHDPDDNLDVPNPDVRVFAGC